MAIADRLIDIAVQVLIASLTVWLGYWIRRKRGRDRVAKRRKVPKEHTPTKKTLAIQEVVQLTKPEGGDSMKKEDVRFLWDMAFSTAAMIARWTGTKADDLVVAALRSDEIFEEVWAMLERRGLAKGNKTSVSKADVAQLTIPPQPGSSEVASA